MATAEDVQKGGIATEELSRAKGARAFLKSEALARSLYLIAGGVAIAAMFVWLQWRTQSICCGDFDGYYHIKWSRTLWEGIKAGHFPPQFKWLPLTTLNPKDYVDHHLLFHILQIPFTWFGDLRLGAKVSAVIFASLAVFSCYWLIVRYRIRYPLLWLVALLACSTPFLYRMNMAKAPPFTIVFMVLGIYLLFERKYLWLLPLSFFFMLAYDLALLLLVAAGIWAAIIGWSERRIEWRPVVWVLIGLAAGLVINPYFPHNLTLFYEHFLMKVNLRGSEFTTKVGGEWYPYDTWEFLNNSLVACVAMVAGYIAFDWSDKKRAQHPLFMLIFSTVLLIMIARWKRIAEYWPPFAIIFAAFSLQPILLGARDALGRLPESVLDELQPFLDRSDEHAAVLAERRETWRWTAATVVAILLCGVLALNLYTTKKDIGDSAERDYYKGGMEWISKNVPAGEVVFNTDWDDFPRMFYYDPNHVYVSGLDPTYLLDKNKDLSDLYDRITTGKEEDPGPLIRDRFGSRYVFTDNTDDHNDFYNNALDSGWFEQVYEDNDCTVLHIRDQKGAPPPDENDQNRSGDTDDDGQDEGP